MQILGNQESLTEQEALGNVEAFALVPNYTPACAEIGLNVFVELPAAAGASYCIYYEIPQNSLSQFFQLNQNNQFTTGFEILVNQDVNGDYNLSYVTDSLGSPTVHTEPGHYYVFYDVPAGSSINSVIRVGAAVTTANVDSYEPNDSIQDAFELSQIADIGTYSGRLDHEFDIDHFTFNAVNGQDVQAEIISPDNSHTLQFFDGITWQQMPEGQDLTLQNPGVMLFRVIPTIAGIVNPSSSYTLKIGSRVVGVTKVAAWSDENLTDVTGMFRKFHKELKWEAQALDSTDNIISGAKIDFEWGTSSINFTSNIKTTGSDGFARGVIQTPVCDGDFKIDRKELITGDMWHIDYDPAVVRWASIDSPWVRVGHTTFILSAFHSCKENLMRTTQNMNSTASCADSSYYCPADYKNPISPRNFTSSSLMWKHRGHSDEIPTFQP